MQIKYQNIRDYNQQQFLLQPQVNQMVHYLFLLTLKLKKSQNMGKNKKILKLLFDH